MKPKTDIESEEEEQLKNNPITVTNPNGSKTTMSMEKYRLLHPPKKRKGFGGFMDRAYRRFYNK